MKKFFALSTDLIREMNQSLNVIITKICSKAIDNLSITTYKSITDVSFFKNSDQTKQEKDKKIYFIFFTIGLTTSCSHSAVYSPSINLTNKPIAAKEFDVQGSIELLPETRPEEINDNLTTLGVNGQCSYDFTNNFNITLKG